MRGATKCGRLCRLRPPGVKLSFQVLRLTQQLGQGQPSLIAMFPHVARFVVNILRWRSFLGCRPRVYFLWKRTFEGQLLHRHPLSLLLWCVLHGSNSNFGLVVDSRLRMEVDCEAYPIVKTKKSEN
jgi:hypothetical protein